MTSDCQISHYSKVQNPTDVQIFLIDHQTVMQKNRTLDSCVLAKILYYETKSLIKQFLYSKSRHTNCKKLGKGASGMNLPIPPNVFLLNTKHLKPYEVTN